MIQVNARGARTLADARPLTYAGRSVYVTVGTETAELHLGGKIVATRPASEIVGMKDAQDWAYEVIETANELVAPAADYNQAVHGPAAQQVRAQAAEVLAEADEQDAKAAKIAARPVNGRDERSPYHPANKAKKYSDHAVYLRKDAVILAAWTALDEALYVAYVSEGLGATDGYFAPEGRAQWKRHMTR